jgi:hypothetical protein
VIKRRIASLCSQLAEAITEVAKGDETLLQALWQVEINRTKAIGCPIRLVAMERESHSHHKVICFPS